MHIAVCMDVAADRKQLERLLGRSADARLAVCDSIPFYIQSYGNKEALLGRPFMYDLFFIDLLHDSMNSVELIRKLRELGVEATIVLCPNSVDLSGELTDEDHVLVLKQPIVARELEEVMDIAVEEMLNKVPKLTIRSNTETYHITEPEFVYAEKQKDTICIHLSDGREIISSENLKALHDRAIFASIKPISESIIVNTGYIENVGFSSVVLKCVNESSPIKLSGNHKYIKKIR